MATVLRLENFDSGRVAQTPKVTELPQEYHDGYAAGVAAAEATMLCSADRLQEEFVQAVQRGQLTHSAIKQNVVGAIAPLLATMISTLLPAALLPVLHARLQNLVSQALQADSAAPLVLNVPPDQVAAVTDALTDTAHPHLTIQADPQLSGNAAWAITPSGETALDLDSALAAISNQIVDLQTLTVPVTEAS